MSNEIRVKEKLAHTYRILAYLGLDDHTYTHVSARSIDDPDCYYIYPFGLCFSEVTADKLIKVTCLGEVVEGQEYQYNRTGYVIHGSIYKARSDINAAIHIHTPEIVAVSTCKQGLLPISQWALHFYNQVAYHAYDSLAIDTDQGSKLVEDFADKYTMLLRSHGSITCGRTMEEALFYTYHLQQACKTQCLTLAMNQELVVPSPATCQKAVHDLLSFEKNLGERDWQAWVRLVN